MKIFCINNTTFGNRIETGQTDAITYSKEFSDDNKLLKYIEKDAKTDKFLKVETFDNCGNRVAIQEYTYLPNKMIEDRKSVV